MPPFSDPRLHDDSAREHRMIVKRAGGGEGDDRNLADSHGGDGGRGAGAELRRIEHDSR